MRILLANKFYYARGGDCIHTIQLKQLLEENGHNVAVYSMQHEENQESEYNAYWPDCVCYEEPSMDGFWLKLKRPFGARDVKNSFKRLLKDFKPDLVHLNNVHTHLSPILTECASTMKIPVVWTMHDYKLMCAASAFLDNNVSLCSSCLDSKFNVVKKKCLKGNLAASILAYMEAFRWNRTRLEANVNRFVVPSLFLGGMMKRFGFSDNKITHIHNFIGEVNSGSVSSRRGREVVYVGRISREKGVETLCRAIAKTDLSLTVIGAGPMYENLSSQYGSEKIVFKGKLNWESIEVILNRSMCLVAPSEWYENNPLVVIEALCCGTPVIGARIGGIPEMVTDADNGYLYESGNVDDLTRALTMVSDHNFDYSSIAENARIEYSKQTYYDKLIKLYKDLVYEVC